ncbi:tudor domain-containing protein 3-like [Penaeus japonicus]|uniref:tudor domain-containing protein 3-like n=1 Tax=Penaeus japonicus TaxID=27405 RepID=UPI001C715F21|nr:tudor domain-containing protein 3-like [Penaeus japonicus]XP_042871539.1 tudor domain-containing protein 3-like [Penaeus japonicus]
MMVSAKEVVARLKGEGWSLSEEGVENLLEGNNFNFQNALQEILNSDLKDVGVPCLPEDVKGKSKTLTGPMVLQVSKIRNVAAPKAFADSNAAPRLLRLSLTDGTNTFQALEIQNIKVISLKTAPGTKVRILGKISFGAGYALLTASNIAVLGGKVEELYEKWRLSQSVSKYSRNVRAADGSGPPLWVPFGKRILKDQAEMRQFKALKDKEGEKDKEDDEFENQRKQTVKELAKEGASKVFGGGKQMLDSNVQKVCRAGFSPEVAEWALRNNKNDPSKAIRELKASISGQPPPSEQKRHHTPDDEDDRRGRGGGRGRGKGRGKGRGRGGGGPDESDDDMPPPNMPRPSGPASLFDFFDVKMSEKKETVNFVEPVADVRGAAYQSGRGGRGGGREGRGGRGGRGRFSSRGGAVNGRSTPPDLASENWPAPGEEKNPPTSNRSYFESKELMEEKEQQENQALRHQQLQASAVGRESAPVAYRNDHGGQYGGYRDSGRRDYGGAGRGYYNSQDSGRGERGGRGGGGGRGNSGGYRGRGGGGYRDSNSNSRGGRGNSNSGYRGDTNSYRDNGGSSNSYRSDGGGGSNSNFRQYEGANSGYRGGNSNYGNYGDSANYGGTYRPDSSGNYRDNGGTSRNDSSYNTGYKDAQGSRSNSNQYNARYDSYSNRQGSQNSYEQSPGGRNGMGGGRGGSYTSGRGGGGGGGGNMQVSNNRTSKEMRLIQDFQRSMTLAGYYQPQEMMNYGRYEDVADYSDFSGTLEFHRGGGSGRGNPRRGGRGGGYY